MVADGAGVWKSRFLDIHPCGRTVAVSHQRCLEECFGLRARERELRRRIRSALKRLGPLEGPARAHVLTLAPKPEVVATVPAALAGLDGAIERIAKRPFSPRQIEEALGITARERLRWTKDGRLPQSGSATIMRGQRITLSTYAVDTVAKLAGDASIIDDWRRTDRVGNLG
uniref:hypothetical protein n=1 Tax=Azospirillum argentinense TaxID=2970906 RepID=UPI001FFF448C|nr:hypothetical protein [Azospirillum argentinense]